MTRHDYKSVHGRTVALAALYQAVRLVQQTARGRARDEHATECSINSIFMTSPASLEEVYDGLSGLALGLEVLCEQLGTNGSARDLELTGYAVTLLHLERRLSRQPALLNEIARGIEAGRVLRDGDQGDAAAMIAMLAGTYTRTISTIAPRVMVQGEPAILNAEQSRNMIRALLLAGMRAAVLWRQCGGGRIRLVFERKRLVEQARMLKGEAVSRR